MESTTNGFQISLTNQPLNSPDVNILDLGFFRAIQSLKDQAAPTNVKELMDVVQDAYAKFSPHTLNKVWLTYQQVMEEIMKVDGGNNYKVPHMGKDGMYREGTLLPYVLHLQEGVYDKCVTTLNGHSVPPVPVVETHEDLLGQFILEEDEGFILQE